jgi:hypothetical protein
MEVVITGKPHPKGFSQFGTYSPRIIKIQGLKKMPSQISRSPVPSYLNIPGTGQKNKFSPVLYPLFSDEPTNLSSIPLPG